MAGSADVRAPLHVPRFVIVGGGPDGAFYVRQLLRARAAGRLATDAIHVVDRDPGCAAACLRDPLVQIESGDWSDWLDARLEAFGVADHLVPYHWAPHLLFDWLARQALRQGAAARRLAPPAPIGLPFERVTSAGDRALSYATWACPPTCIEPAACPHTRGPKAWSLARDLARDEACESLVLPCLHLVYGVSTIPLAAVFAARDRLVAALATRPRRFLVATSSHCHALAARLEVLPARA